MSFDSHNLNVDIPAVMKASANLIPAEADLQNITTETTTNISGNKSKTNSSKNNSKAASNEFVRKLYNILENNEYPDIVRWTARGDSFVVLDTGKFTTKILPNHFKHSNFASFVRQLNKYDFHKIKTKPDDKEKLIYGELSWEFQHPCFRIHDASQLDNIKRKLTSQKKMDDRPPVGVNKNHPSQQNEQGAMHTVSNDTINLLRKRVDGLEKELRMYKDENLNSKVEVQKLNSKYNTVLSSLVAFKTVNENLMNNFNILCSTLVNHGIELPHPLYATGNYHSSKSTGPDSSGNSSKTHNPLPLMVQDTKFHSQQQGVVHQADSMMNISNNTTISPPVKSEESLDLNNIVLRKGFHVLLVEDDAISIQLCSKFLRKYGCTVEVVTDGLSAISTLEKFRYDLVLMDIVMPNLDGATATSIIRSFDNQTPIIAMTGNIEDQDLITYLQHGMNDILAKPFTRDDLHSMLIRYLKDRVPLCEQQSSQQDRRLSSQSSHNQSNTPQQHLQLSVAPQQISPSSTQFPSSNQSQSAFHNTAYDENSHILKKQHT
ncbi:hypothetical protein KAFR_0B06990 [Kazachstania africana CBS 2517]|uniref:Transcription factor n=1 Tax=Kazachstania africana (strain ATCC 22294 / BCRC 22015 / CBS 2517 / CECT 1963 / NBRC 1671 / NRRL Y-8276) TaxID=1071382 RepID=H2ARJ7_KAZAF|nr:hypothetical protein KAFR_0B06990 [Kazachstania africana CBS 2517]CCF56997.1 hypothetical protein KAFR_0B06990 [Kazachstania africana CBS 2517]